MKHLKMLVAAGTAAILVLAIGGGSASATVLCKTTANPCPAESKLLTGTKVEGTLPVNVPATLESTDKETVNIWCWESTFSFTTSTTGSSMETVKAAVTKWSWANCTTAKKLVPVKTGEIEIHYLEGTGTGTLTGKNMEFTAESVLGSDCVYGTKGGVVHLGVTREPGALETKSQIEINAVFVKVSGSFCPEDVRVGGRYLVNTPVPLYVAGS